MFDSVRNIRTAQLRTELGVQAPEKPSPGILTDWLIAKRNY